MRTGAADMAESFGMSRGLAGGGQVLLAERGEVDVELRVEGDARTTRTGSRHTRPMFWAMSSARRKWSWAASPRPSTTAATTVSMTARVGTRLS